MLENYLFGSFATLPHCPMWYGNVLYTRAFRKNLYPFLKPAVRNTIQVSCPLHYNGRSQMKQVQPNSYFTAKPPIAPFEKSMFNIIAELLPKISGSERAFDRDLLEHCMRETCMCSVGWWLHRHRIRSKRTNARKRQRTNYTLTLKKRFNFAKKVIHKRIDLFRFFEERLYEFGERVEERKSASGV